MGTNTPISHLADRLKQAGRTTQDYFGGLRPEDWQITVYPDGSRWSVHAILAHFVSAERAMQTLLRNILSGNPAAATDMDMDTFNEMGVARLCSRDPHVLLLDFKTARTATLTLLNSMSEADLQRRGLHPWLGNTTLYNIIKLIYQHNRVHQRDMRRVLHTRDKDLAQSEHKP